jgi:hypothetical protein
MSEEPERLRRAVDRLLDTQQKVLDATSRALAAEAEGLNEDERLGASERLKAALVNVRNILEDGA